MQIPAVNLCKPPQVDNFGCKRNPQCQQGRHSCYVFSPTLLYQHNPLFRRRVQQLSAVNNADKSAAAAKQNSFPRRGGGGGQISNFMTPFGCNCEGAFP